jgi:hypothetical protein
MVVRISYDAARKVINPLFRVVFYRNDGLMVIGTNTYRQGSIWARSMAKVPWNWFSIRLT